VEGGERNMQVRLEGVASTQAVKRALVEALQPIVEKLERIEERMAKIEEELSKAPKE